MFGRLRSEYLFHIGQYLVKSGSYDTAIRYLEMARKLSPSYYQISCHLARCLCFASRNEQVLGLLGELLEEYPENPVVSYYAGLCFFDSEEFVKAEKRFRVLVTKFPQNSYFRAYLGLSLLFQARREEALDFLRLTSDKLSPEYAGKLLYILEKEIYDTEKKLGGARDFLWGERVKQVHLNSPSSIRTRLPIYLELFIIKAFLHITTPFDTDKRNAKKALYSAFEMLESHNIVEALATLHDLAERNVEDSSMVSEALFYAHMEDKSFDEALRVFTAWVKDDLKLSEPIVDNIWDDDGLAVMVGKMYLALHDYGQAVKWFNKALACDQKNYESHYYLGLCLVAQGEADLAVSSFTEAIKQIHPKAVLDARLRSWNRTVLVASL